MGRLFRGPTGHVSFNLPLGGKTMVPVNVPMRGVAVVFVDRAGRISTPRDAVEAMIIQDGVLASSLELPNASPLERLAYVAMKARPHVVVAEHIGEEGVELLRSMGVEVSLLRRDGTCRCCSRHAENH